MHYVNCVYCEAYYSQEGNPFEINDFGEHVCMSCVDGLLEIKQTVTDNTVSFYIMHSSLSEIHEYLCDEIEHDLRKHNAEYTKISHADDETEFILSKEQVVMLELAGANMDCLFQTP